MAKWSKQYRLNYKTIHEMAVDYGHEHQGTCNIEDFEAGAEAVLKVIEPIIFSEFQHKIPRLQMIMEWLRCEYDEH